MWHWQVFLYAHTEIRDGFSQTNEFFLPIRLHGKGIGLSSQPSHPLLECRASVLVFGQWNDSCEIAFCQAIQLVFDLNTSTPQIFATRLEFLWQPPSALCTFQGMRDAFRMHQNFAQVLPDEHIQLLCRNETRWAFVFTATLHCTLFAGANVATIVDFRHRARKAG